MAAIAHSPSRHLVSRVVASLAEQVASVKEASLWSMSTAETEQTLVALTRLTGQLAELELRVAEHAGSVGVGDAQGATSTAAWWAHATRQTRLETHRKMRLALGLEQFPVVRDALAGEVRAQAQARLVVLAREHDAKSLRILGRRILEVLDPVAADEAEAKKLAEEDRKTNATERSTMSQDGHGRVHGRFTLSAVQGAMLKKLLLGLAAPKHVAATQGAGVERAPGPERLGRAFGGLIQRYPADKVPAAGGANATVVVTMGLASAGHRRCWTWGVDAGSTPSPNASRWPSSSVGVRPKGVTGRRACATPTTRSLGARADPPLSDRAGCSARATTPAPTTPTSRRPSSPAARSPSPGVRRPTAPHLAQGTMPPWPSTCTTSGSVPVCWP